MTALERAFNEAASGRGRTVLVTGEAGIGKTALVAKLAQRVRRAGARVVVGECAPLVHDVPYVAIEEILRQVEGSAGLAVLARRRDVDRATLFQSIAGMLTAARDEPLVVVVEDVHWADVSTRDLVVYLSRAVRNAPVLLIVTYRTDELPPDHPLLDVVAELSRCGRAERVDVPPIEPVELADLLEHLTGAPPSRRLRDAVHRRTEGNPFFVHEFVTAGLDVDRLPNTVREVVLARVGRLPKPAQSLARLVAVLGRTSSHDLVAAVSDLGTNVDVLLRELVAHHVLTRRGADHYQFRHALVQEALYDDMLAGERRAAHERVARVLTERPRLSPAPTPTAALAEVAHHWYAAGRCAPAFAASIRAGLASRAAFAPSEAHGQLERALRLWTEVDDPEALAGMSRVQLRERVAEFASLAGHNDRAVDLVTELLGEFDEDLEPERVAMLYERRRYYAWAAGDPDRAWADAQRAVALMPPDAAGHPRVLAAAATGLLHVARCHEGARQAERATAVARERGDIDALCRASLTLGCCLALVGYVEQGVRHVRDALTLARDPLDDKEKIWFAYNNLVVLLAADHRFDDALAVAREGLDTACGPGFSPNATAKLSGQEAWSLALLGRWDEALTVAAQAADSAVDLFFVEWGELVAAQIHARRGNLQEAATLLPPSEIAVRQPSPGQNTDGTAVALAEVALARAGWNEARTVLDWGLGVLLGQDHQRGVAELTALAVRCEADAMECSQQALVPVDRRAAIEAADRRLAALDAYVTAQQRAGAALLPWTRFQVALARAERTRLDDEPHPAAWEAIAHADSGDRFLVAYGRFRLAEALLVSGRSRRLAGDELRAAHREAYRLGAAPLQAKIEDLGRRSRTDLTDDPQLTGRADAASSALCSRFSLTPRELEVLRLIAGGMTNRAIGVTLFISAKTASVHVTNILRKLGVSSRIQAAAIGAPLVPSTLT